jgi:hypothetical protein
MTSNKFYSKPMLLLFFFFFFFFFFFLLNIESQKLNTIFVRFVFQKVIVPFLIIPQKKISLLYDEMGMLKKYIGIWPKTELIMSIN